MRNFSLINLEGLRWVSPTSFRPKGDVYLELGITGFVWRNVINTIFLWISSVGLNNETLTSFLAELRNWDSHCHGGQRNVEKELHDNNVKEIWKSGFW